MLVHRDASQFKSKVLKAFLLELKINQQLYTRRTSEPVPCNSKLLLMSSDLIRSNNFQEIKNLDIDLKLHLYWPLLGVTLDIYYLDCQAVFQFFKCANSIWFPINILSSHSKFCSFGKSSYSDIAGLLGLCHSEAAHNFYH